MPSSNAPRSQKPGKESPHGQPDERPLVDAGGVSTIAASSDRSPESQFHEAQLQGGQPQNVVQLRADFWRRKSFWRPPASKLLRKGIDEAQWREYIEMRRWPASLVRLAQGSSTPLAWGVRRECLTAATCELLRLLDAHFAEKRKSGKPGRPRLRPWETLERWCDAARLWIEHPRQAKGEEADSSGSKAHALHDVGDFALACLAAAHLLPILAPKAKETRWWSALGLLWQIAENAAGWPIERPARENAALSALDARDPLPIEDRFAVQALAGELPLTLSYLFPEMKPLHALRAPARDRLSVDLVEQMNGIGLPSGRWIGQFPLLLASWTRCRLMGAELKKNCWSSKAESQYRWAVRQALMWTSPAGAPLLADGASRCSWSLEFLGALLRLAGDGSDVAAARELFGRRTLNKGLGGKELGAKGLGAKGLGRKALGRKALGRKALGRKALVGKSYHAPETSEHCEWSGLAVLRTHWQPDGAVAALRYMDKEVTLELAQGGAPLFRGAWSWTTTIDDQIVKPAGAWEEVCWITDEDVDYLELSIDLTHSARLDRQILLARKDRMAWLADHVTSPHGSSVRHSWRLPLAEGVRVSSESDTREAYLEGARPVATAIPVALPEWRAAASGGNLECVEESLQITQKGTGCAVACPLFLDLQPQRSKAQVTWRQLTVAQSLAIQPSHVAAGFRVQCGQQQWLFYRALASRGNRTLLGQNTSSEFLASRFFASTGEAETLIEIEG